MKHDYHIAKVAAANFDVAVGNPQINAERICEIISYCGKNKIDVVAFPELALTGYTCGDLFLQSYMDEMMWDSMESVVKETIHMPQNAITVIGAPVRKDGMLFNCAILIRHGKIIGIVPKSYIPNHGEFYEKRWFAPASYRLSDTISVTCGGRTYQVPFKPDIIVEAPHGVRLACEICEDLWVPCPPSSFHTLHGANVIVNPSASNEVAAKAAYRRDLVRVQSGRCICAYVYTSSGIGESTTDLVFSGHKLIAENGTVIKESIYDTGILIAYVDTERIANNRLRNNTVSYEFGLIQKEYTTIPLESEVEEESELPDYITPYPFVPPEDKKAERCQAIMTLQELALMERLRKTGIRKCVIGISGGLDSTLALLVAVEAYKKLGWPLKDIIGVTMPGFGTSDRTKDNSILLMNLVGIKARNIDIKKSCLQHLEDIAHDPDVYDVTYENVQARERTQILMDVANQEGGIVIGTGDMSELALGWCTYNGDHMSMYNVNAGIPKTLIQYLIKTYAETTPELSNVLYDICGTTISPELLPQESVAAGIQSTEGTIGKYALHDFFLYHFLRNGFGAQKIRILAGRAFPALSKEEIEKTLAVFYHRFFSQQFKRSCMPDGPKIGTVSLSPRGDWRMPSDISCPEMI